MKTQRSRKILTQEVANIAYDHGAESVWHFGSSVAHPESARDVDIAIVTNDLSARLRLIDALAGRWPEARIEDAHAYTGGKLITHTLHIILFVDRDLTRPIGQSMVAGQYVHRGA